MSPIDFTSSDAAVRSVAEMSTDQEAARTVVARVSDELAFHLTGFRPEQLSDRDAAVIRERAQRMWDALCSCAATPSGATS